MTDEKYAVWLLFDESDEKYLSKIISELSHRYDSSKFIPHITIYGLIDANLEIINESVTKSINEINSFKVTKNKILYSDYIWKTLYIEFYQNENMTKINDGLKKTLSVYSRYELKPHCSLIYKKLPIETKQNIISSLDVKEDFIVNGIGIQKFSENVSEWKLVRKYMFDS